MNKTIFSVLLTISGLSSMAMADNSSNIPITIDNILAPISIKITQLNNLNSSCLEIDNIVPDKTIINFDPTKNILSPCYKDKQFTLWVMKGTFGKFSKIPPATVSASVHQCETTWEISLLNKKLTGINCK